MPRLADFIGRWDQPGMLFYLDPSYRGCEDDYGTGMFDRSMFETITKTLACITGRFILAINGVPEIRRIFGKFESEDVGLSCSIANGKGTEAHELIITGPR